LVVSTLVALDDNDEDDDKEEEAEEGLAFLPSKKMIKNP